MGQEAVVRTEAGRYRSLEEASVVELRPQMCYTSRSGRTILCTGLEARLESSRHVHMLSCVFTRSGLACTWEMDGRDMGMIEIPYSDPLAKKLIATLDVSMRIEKIGNLSIDLTPEERNIVTLSRRSVMLLPLEEAKYRR